jgi:pyruvate dehydrogenase E2 component (dihydrolipoamide acetyltransferase)
MTDFRMPSLGADMEKGTVVEWLVEPGDTVARGDVILLVETEKGIIEVEIWHDSRIEALLVPVGKEALVGTVLATLHDDGSSPPARRRVSPRARAVSAELGVDPSLLETDDVVTEAAVREAAGRTAVSGASSTGMRTAIARTMTRSKQTIPHYYLSTTVDMEPALAWLADHNASKSITERIVPAALLIKATSLAVAEVPEMNGHMRNDSFEATDVVHLGVAISTRAGGLVAPAIRDCQERPLDDVMRQLTDLVRRARTGRLRESEVTAPTLTVTNLGDRGVEAGYGVIIPPQVALVCFGKIVEHPRIVDGAIVARRVINAALSADHRVSDGHRGGLFLEAISEHLQKPEAL